MKNRADKNVFDRRRDHDAKREAVLRIAAEMFNKRGYAATSLDEIAQHFSISKTALYYYVESKPVLLQMCYELTLNLCEQVMVDVLASNSTGVEKIEAYFRGVIAGVLKTGPVAIVHEFATLPKDAFDHIHSRARMLDSKLAAIIETGIADGSIAEVPPKLTELILMGANNWIQRWYNPEGDKTLEEVADCFIFLFVNGLKSRTIKAD
ncbi:MAG: TetR family transcriptional regulator [Rhizobiaceae bacterium]|nr:TetR family transcriptional regulator [Rhizobiaceae bacterium]